MAVDHVVYGGVLDWGGIEKFAWPRTFRRRFRGFSKKERSGPSGIGDKPFGDRGFQVTDSGACLIAGAQQSRRIRSWEKG